MLIVFLVLGLLAIGFAWLFVRRFQLRSTERAVRAPLMRALDPLLEALTRPDTLPLGDLKISAAKKDRRGTSASYYYVYLRNRTYLSFSRSGSGDSAVYTIGHWDSVLKARTFPPSRYVPCRSPWYVDRMRRLAELLDTYPPDRTLRAEAHRVIEAINQRALGNNEPPPEA